MGYSEYQLVQDFFIKSIKAFLKNKDDQKESRISNGVLLGIAGVSLLS